MTLYKNSLPFNQFRQIIKGVGEILEDFELNSGSYCNVIEHLTVLEAVPESDEDSESVTRKPNRRISFILRPRDKFI